jgi:hypothetical protein
MVTRFGGPPPGMTQFGRIDRNYVAVKRRKFGSIGQYGMVMVMNKPTS